MKKRITYVKSFLPENMVRVEEFNENGKVIKDIHYNKGKIISEAVTEYDKNGNIVSEAEQNEDGETITRYEYTDENKILSHRQFFNEELYESVHYSYNNDTTTIETFQDDELVSRYVKTQRKDKTGSEEYYDLEGKMTERHVSLFDEAQNSYITEIYNEDNNLSSKIIERASESGKPMEVIYLNEEGKLYRHQIVHYENEKPIEVQSTDYYADVVETVCKNSYDDKGRLIYQQLFNANEELIQDCHVSFNEQGDIIEERSHYTGGYNSAAGILNNGRSFHFVYKIEY